MQTTHEILKNLDRLQKRSDFLRVQAEGKKWTAPGAILQAAPGRKDQPARVGFTVTKRLDKRAVARNRIRRRLRAAAADVMAARALPGMDYVLIGRHGTADRDYAALKDDIVLCLRKVGCLRGEGSSS
jgi:ribonuclease P protein component